MKTTSLLDSSFPRRPVLSKAEGLESRLTGSAWIPARAPLGRDDDRLGFQRRRYIVSLCALISLLSLLFVVSPASPQSAPEKMIVGYSAQAGAYAPIWITKEAGLFRKNGLDVNLVFIPGGPTAAAAMIANEVQAMAMAGPAIVSSHLAGSDLVMTAGIVNTFAFQLVTVKSITSANQLKGKRIGVNRFGAAPDVAARYALNHLKIDPREVTILQLGEQSTRLEAMKAGQLDAARVIDVDDGGRTRRQQLEQPSFGREVLRHVAVKIQMVPREVREDPGGESHVGDTLQHEGVRGHFHRAGLAAAIDHLAQQPLHVRRLRRGVRGFALVTGRGACAKCHCA